MIVTYSTDPFAWSRRGPSVVQFLVRSDQFGCCMDDPVRALCFFLCCGLNYFRSFSFCVQQSGCGSEEYSGHFFQLLCCVGKSDHGKCSNPSAGFSSTLELGVCVCVNVSVRVRLRCQCPFGCVESFRYTVRREASQFVFGLAMLAKTFNAALVILQV